MASDLAHHDADGTFIDELLFTKPNNNQQDRGRRAGTTKVTGNTIKFYKEDQVLARRKGKDFVVVKDSTSIKNNLEEDDNSDNYNYTNSNSNTLIKNTNSNQSTPISLNKKKNWEIIGQF